MEGLVELGQQMEPSMLLDHDEECAVVLVGRCDHFIWQSNPLEQPFVALATLVGQVERMALVATLVERVEEPA